MRLLDLGTVSWLESQALYHGLAACMTEGTPDTVILVRPDAPHFCIGYHQDAGAVLDLEACRALGMPVLRRRLGGGAVYLDGNQLYYQCIFHKTRVPARVDALFARCLGPVVAALREVGLGARLRRVNEIEVGGRRIAGTGAGQIGEASVVVGNVLFDFDYEVMARAWRAPSAPFRGQAARALREHLTTLRREMPHPPAPEQVRGALARAYARDLGRPLLRGALTEGERAAVACAASALADPAWLSRGAGLARPGLKIAAGVFVREVEVATTAGPLRLTGSLRNGALEALAIWGEAASALGDPEGIAAALRGARPDEPADIGAHLARLNGALKVPPAWLAEAIGRLAGCGDEG